VDRADRVGVLDGEAASLDREDHPDVVAAVAAAQAVERLDDGGLDLGEAVLRVDPADRAQQPVAAGLVDGWVVPESARGGNVLAHPRIMAFRRGERRARAARELMRILPLGWAKSASAERQERADADSARPMGRIRISFACRLG